MQKFAKLAALGAFAVIGGLGFVYGLFIAWLTWPNGEGMDRTESGGELDLGGLRRARAGGGSPCVRAHADWRVKRSRVLGRKFLGLD